MEAEITNTTPSNNPTYYDIRQGFVYERVPHITLKSIANNTEIDTIWQDYQTRLEPLREALNQQVNQNWQEWEIPRELEPQWSEQAKQLHQQWGKERIARQKKIDASIAAKADFEYLYDKPYEDKNIVRVAGPFTVESLSPHRVLAVDHDEQLIDPNKTSNSENDFATVILDNFKTAGVQQAHKENKIQFTNIIGWPGKMICAQGHYQQIETS